MTKRVLLGGVLASVVIGSAVTTFALVVPGPAAGPQHHPGWATVGDSITYGMGSSDPGTRSFPAQAGIPARGITGQCLVLAGCTWQPLVESFPSELASLQRDDVDAVVVEIGINDLGRVTDQQYADAYARLQAEGEAQGVRVVLSTITPLGRTAAFTSAAEQQRERVNAWIRSQDAYVDFDAALRSGGGLAARYDCGDGMHPDDAGHARLADTLDRWISQDG